MYADELIRPWHDSLRQLVPALKPFDVHTHTGWNDPDGFSLRVERLTEALEQIDGRAALFTLADPGGYRAANDRILAECAESGGRLVPFCRVDPRAAPVAEAERALAAGARGIKLHPRAEAFRLADPDAAPVFDLADERGLPVLVHAGRGIPALGRDAVDLARRHPRVRLILAHAGISDLAWIWREAADTPNLFFDTSWWNAADLIALFAFVPPGQILFGSDAPYGTPMHGALLTARCALHAGLSHEQLVEVMGGQAARIVDGQEPLDLGPAPGPEGAAGDLLLERVIGYLYGAIGRAMVNEDPEEQLTLARLACEVGDDAPQAPACRSILALLDRHDHFFDDPRALEDVGEGARFFPSVHLMILAACVARTPSVPAAEPDFEDVGERQHG